MVGASGSSRPKREYGLGVDPAERDRRQRLLTWSPDEITCGQAGSTDPASSRRVGGGAVPDLSAAQRDL